MDSLIGKKFNFLTVIDGPFYNNKRKQWLCKCNCGNFKTIQEENLKNEMTKSCGCLHKKKISTNLINQQFGLLTVIKDTGKRNYNRNIIWECQCECGNKCEIPTTHLRSGHTCSCGCFKSSKGENKIKQLLKNNNIPFTTQKTFEDLIIHKHLYFDFFVNNQYLIEYDGEQHFKQIKNNFFDKSLEEQQKYDNFKNQWCKTHNIPLIRIPYTHFKNICLEDLLLETSNFIWKENL